MGAGVRESPESRTPAAPLPRRLGRYELIQLLAMGGMGEVHLARTRGLGGFERLVVIKCALPGLAERTQSMLLAEARLAATLQHTNIVQVQDVDTDGDTVFLAMEYLHGQDIRAVVRRAWGQGRPLPLDQAIAIVIAVCAGLHYAHDKLDSDGSPLEIVHRDVSPSNVFVTYDGGVKLIDFGIAKATTLPSDTQLGTIKGKPGYMSPEQCRCEPIDRRSDVFCVGILLYELTTGRRAFTADNEYLLTKQIIDDDPARPSTFDASYPVELEAIAMRALAKDRRDRHASALAIQDELAAFARGRRLDLSQLALAREMAALFADELAAWHAAQRAGQSLVEHVIKRTTASAAIVDLPVGTSEQSAPTAAPRRRRVWPWLVGGAAIAGGIATAVVVSAASSPAVAPPSASPTTTASPIPISSPAPSSNSSPNPTSSQGPSPGPNPPPTTSPSSNPTTASSSATTTPSRAPTTVVPKPPPRRHGPAAKSKTAPSPAPPPPLPPLDPDQPI